MAYGNRMTGQSDSPWHVLDISSVPVEEFASALRSLAPTLGLATSNKLVRGTPLIYSVRNAAGPAARYRILFSTAGLQQPTAPLDLSPGGELGGESDRPHPASLFVAS